MNRQVRHALVLSALPPSLVLDGAGRAGDACIAGGGEVASVLLSLPRPFQVSAPFFPSAPCRRHSYLTRD